MATYGKRERTKRQIYEAAHALFLKKGYSNTSLYDIADAAGVSKGTLYNHYHTKGDFIIEAQVLSVEHLAEFAQNLPTDLPTLERVCMLAAEDVHGISKGFAMERIVDGSVEADLALASLSESFTSVARLQEQFAIRRKLRDIYAGIIDDGIANGELTPETDATLLAELVIALYFHEIEFLIIDFRHDFANEFRKKVSVVLKGQLLR